MFDPFDMGASPFANTFQQGPMGAYAGREDQMRRQKEAFERARKQKKELLDNELRHGKKMAEQYKVPYQPKDWVSAAANTASAIAGAAREQGWFQPKNDNTRSLVSSFTMKPTQEIQDAASRYYTPPSSWNFDASRAFQP